jgi:hypothetical protein
MRKSCCVAAAILAACAPSVSAQSVPADMILHGGKVVTLDKRSSIAQAVAIRDGKFLAVGSDADIKRFSGPSTKLIDLGGGTIERDPATREATGTLIGAARWPTSASSCPRDIAQEPASPESR